MADSRQPRRSVITFRKTTEQMPDHVIEACRRRWIAFDALQAGVDAMTPERRAKPEVAGYTVTTAKDFLGLDEVDRQIVALWLAVPREVRRLREEQQLTQRELAESPTSRKVGMPASTPSSSPVSRWLAAASRLPIGSPARHSKGKMAGVVSFPNCPELPMQPRGFPSAHITLIIGHCFSTETRHRSGSPPLIWSLGTIPSRG